MNPSGMTRSTCDMAMRELYLVIHTQRCRAPWYPWAASKAGWPGSSRVTHRTVPPKPPCRGNVLCQTPTQGMESLVCHPVVTEVYANIGFCSFDEKPCGVRHRGGKSRCPPWGPWVPTGSRPGSAFVLPSCEFSPRSLGAITKSNPLCLVSCCFGPRTPCLAREDRDTNLGVEVGGVRKASLGVRVCVTQLLSSPRPRNMRCSLSHCLITRRPSPDALAHPQCTANPSAPRTTGHTHPPNTQARKLGATSVHTPHYILLQILVFSPAPTPPLRNPLVVHFASGGPHRNPSSLQGPPPPCWALSPLLFLAPPLPRPLRSQSTAPPHLSRAFSCPRGPQPHPGREGDTGAGGSKSMTGLCPRDLT